MRGDPLPDTDHVARYCKPTTIVGGQPTGAAFMLRPIDSFLSVNWLEHFGDIGQDGQISEIREHISLGLAPSGLFAVLDVGETIAYVYTNSVNITLSILHEPEQDDLSHSGIHGYGYEDDMVADLISEQVRGLYPTT